MRIAIFGLGSIGKRHVRNLVDMGEKDLCICDVNPLALHIVQQMGASPIRIAELAYDVWNWQPEAVLICTPPREHYNLAIQAIDQGCHLFIEKPIATHSQDANDIVWRNDDKKVLAVGYQLRFNRLDIERHQYKNKINIVHQQDMSIWPSQYKKDILQEFSHEIDVAIYLNGPAETVVARRSALRWDIEIHHQHGFSRLHISAAPGPFARWIDCDKFHDQPGVGNWSFNKEGNDQAYKDELAAFLKACRGEGWDDRLCSGAEAVHVCKIIEAARESAQDCKVVHLA